MGNDLENAVLLFQELKAGGLSAAAAALKKRLLDAVDSFDWAKWNAQRRKLLTREFATVTETAGRQAARTLNSAWDIHDPYVEKTLTSYIGDRIVSLDETTRQAVKDLIQSALEDGGALSAGALGDKIKTLVQETYGGWEDWRADRIARTETAIAYNYGHIFAYRDANVDQVVVSDGDGDEACAEADGQIWSLEEALANPTEHPNCVRAFAPYVPEQGEE